MIKIETLPFEEYTIETLKDFSSLAITLLKTKPCHYKNAMAAWLHSKDSIDFVTAKTKINVKPSRICNSLAKS